MKTKIKVRRVYYKYAEIEVDVPNELDDDWIGLTDYLHDNPNKWESKLELAIDNAKLERGLGMDSDDGWTDIRDSEEIRYEVDFDKDSYKMGGHL